jgi:DNA-directed RNA polymerase specialized sigma subunit
MDLIEQHRCIARKIAGWYTLRARHLADDLNSAAMEGVVTAVDRINRGLVSHDNYYGYICYFIHCALGKEIRLNETITPPQRRPHKNCVSLDNPIATLDPSIGVCDVMEELNVAIDGDKLTKQIVDLRIIGHTDEEIADMLDLGRLVIQRARKRLFKKWRIIHVR